MFGLKRCNKSFTLSNKTKTILYILNIIIQYIEYMFSRYFRVYNKLIYLTTLYCVTRRGRINVLKVEKMLKSPNPRYHFMLATNTLTLICHMEKRSIINSNCVINKVIIITVLITVIITVIITVLITVDN